MATDFVKGLRTWLTETAQRVDVGFAANADVGINVKGEPVLRRRPRPMPSASAHAFEAALLDRMPERSLLDILWRSSTFGRRGPVLSARSLARSQNWLTRSHPPF